MNNYIQVKCLKCKNDFVTTLFRGEVEEEHKKCEKCNETNEIINFNQIKDPNVILNVVDCHLEDINFHSIGNAHRDIWDKVKDYIPNEKKAEVARNIALVFDKL